MADIMYMYAVTAGVFVALGALVLVARAQRYRKGFNTFNASSASSAVSNNSA